MNEIEKQKLVTLFIRGHNCSDDDYAVIKETYTKYGRDVISDICAKNKILPWAASTLQMLNIDSAYWGG